MYPPNQEHTSFITNRELYYYIVMPFNLKNTRATFQRLVNQMFVQQISKIMEIYVNDTLVKSIRIEDHLAHLTEMFNVLYVYEMKLN